MRTSVLIGGIAAPLLLAAQGPTVTSWIINPGNETGYGGYATNVQAVSYTATDVYVACTCIPGYDIGPWAGNPNTPANQDFVFRITRQPQPNSGTPVGTPLGHIGVWRNGVSVFNAKDGMSYNGQGIWERDAYVFEGGSFDLCLGHPAPNGEYHHHVSPTCLYDQLNDEAHSDLIGYAFDGYPIYGAYGYANADGTGGTARMRSSYQLRSITERTTLPDGTALTAGQYGPAVGGAYPLGAFLQDYAYVAASGDLDEHNGRFCMTPEYPGGTYAYFVTLDADGDPAYPYTLGPTYYGTVPAGNTGPQSGHNTVPGDAIAYDPTATEVPETAATDDIVLFPVPSSDRLFIRSVRPVLGLDVLDGQGRIVAQRPASSGTLALDVSGLAAGVYTLRLTTAKGSSVRTFLKD